MRVNRSKLRICARSSCPKVRGYISPGCSEAFKLVFRVCRVRYVRFSDEFNNSVCTKARKQHFLSQRCNTIKPSHFEKPYDTMAGQGHQKKHFSKQKHQFRINSDSNQP